MDKLKVETPNGHASSEEQSADELIKDLDVRVSPADQTAIVGGDSAQIGIIREPTKHPA